MVELNELFSGADKELLTAIRNNTAFTSIYDFAANTNERSERTALAKKLNCPKHTLYYYAKLADLLQCPDLSLEDARFLIQTGVRCVSDLYYLNADKYLAYINEYGFSMPSKIIDEACVSKWISAARILDKRVFECDEADTQNNKYTYYVEQSAVRKPSTSMGADLKDIISELGAGLAEAQKALDENSIAVQKEILADPQLRSYGLNATWYTIPETTFSLKMTYQFSEENTESAKMEGSGTKSSVMGSRLRMKIVPSNATINNTYKTSGSQESTLTLRFVPIPPPEGMTDRLLMPDLVGRTINEATNMLAELNLEYELVRANGMPTNGKETEVLRQSLSANASYGGPEELETVEANTYIMPRSRIALTYTDATVQDKPTEEVLITENHDTVSLQSILNEAKQAAVSARKSADAASNSASDAEKSAKNAASEAKDARKTASEVATAAKTIASHVNTVKEASAAAKDASKSAASDAYAAKESATDAETSARNAASNAEEAKKYAQMAENEAKKAEKGTTPQTDPEKTYKIRITDSGREKIKVIKLVKDKTGMGLKEAKTLVDETPCIAFENLTDRNAQALLIELEALGASAEIIEV